MVVLSAVVAPLEWRPLVGQKMLASSRGASIFQSFQISIASDGRYTLYIPSRGIEMPNILLKNLPEAVHQKLNSCAAHHHRSVTGEIIACLESIVSPKVVDVELEIERVKLLRKRVKDYLTPTLLKEYKEAGRK